MHLLAGKMHLPLFVFVSMDNAFLIFQHVKSISEHGKCICHHEKCFQSFQYRKCIKSAIIGNFVLSAAFFVAVEGRPRYDAIKY